MYHAMHFEMDTTARMGDGKQCLVLYITGVLIKEITLLLEN